MIQLRRIINGCSLVKQAGRGRPARVGRSALFLLVLACTAFARDEYTRSFDKTVPLQSGGKVSIEHRLGDIVIRTHPDQTVVIHAEIHTSGPDRNEAEQFANRVEILSGSASGVAIRTNYPSGFGDFSYYVRYELTIPEDAPLDVRSSFGSVSVSGLKANGNIRTSHGAVSFRDGKGTQHIDNSFGAVDVIGNAGGVTITNTNGQIKLEDCGAAVIKNAFGAVLIKNAAGKVTVESKNGAVNVNNAQGAEINMSFGAVILNAISGPIQVENRYGSVEVSGIGGSACQPIEVHTSYSPIVVRLNSSPNYSVSAQTSYSRIHTDFPLEVSGALSNDGLHGKLGNGRCEMSLSSSYGPIQILRSGN